MEHDQAAKFAWHIAFMSSYAPEKPKDFWRLASLLWKDRTDKKANTPWKDKFAAMANWVAAFKRP